MTAGPEGRLALARLGAEVERAVEDLESSAGRVDRVMRLLGRMSALDWGAPLDALYVCPHHPDESCNCRKPNTGLIDQAVRERVVDLTRSYLIGDHARDMELAKRVGSRSILVTTGAVSPYQVEDLKASGLIPDRVASSLSEASEWLLSDVRSRSAQTDERQVTHP